MTTNKNRERLELRFDRYMQAAITGLCANQQALTLSPNSSEQCNTIIQVAGYLAENAIHEANRRLPYLMED